MKFLMKILSIWGIDWVFFEEIDFLSLTCNFVGGGTHGRQSFVSSTILQISEV